MVENSLKHAVDVLREAVNKAVLELEVNKLNPSLIQTGEYYKYIAENYSAISELTKLLNSIKDEISKGILPLVMEANNVSNITIGDRQLIVGGRMHASIPQHKLDLGLKWLKDNGYGNIVKEGVNSITLTAAMKAYTEEHGMLPPEDAISVHIDKYVSIKKVSK